MFNRTPSGSGPGRRAAMKCRCVFWVGRLFSSLFSILFFFERTRSAASMRPPCLFYPSTSTKTRPKERRNRGCFFPIGKKHLVSGVRTGCHFVSSLCVPLCVTSIFFSDCGNYTRPTFTNLGSVEAGEYRLTRGTCFLACRLELDAVAGLLWISWCVSGGALFSVFFFRFRFPWNTHGLPQV